jgi:hypothetical protein
LVAFDDIYKKMSKTVRIGSLFYPKRVGKWG